MTQSRRAEVHVTCDVPGCLETWHYAGEREHNSGRPGGDWVRVWLGGGATFTPPGMNLDLDFCPKHGRTEAALRVVGAHLVSAKAKESDG
jgi:hypothetical protein